MEGTHNMKIVYNLWGFYAAPLAHLNNMYVTELFLDIGVSTYWYILSSLGNVAYRY